MDERTDIYDAAVSGKLDRLRIHLDHRTQEEVSKLVHSKRDGATPLISACVNGHLDVVKYLIESCSADIDEVGFIVMDKQDINAASPLWCAAAAGHLGVVIYLIEKGAGVNQTTSMNSTPLRAACYNGHIGIVKYLVEHGADIEIARNYGNTCLMLSCYKGHEEVVGHLLASGADVNRKNREGNTALHCSAGAGHLEIMKLLLQNGARMEKGDFGLTPLLAAAVAGSTNIVDFLIDQKRCSREEKIDALELLGAIYAEKNNDMQGAIQMWSRALEERYKYFDKFILKPETVSTISAYENVEEFTSCDQLEDLLSDPDAMRMQALLVRERILGPAHPDTLLDIRYRGAQYADMEQFDRCVVLWMFVLDMQQEVMDPLNKDTIDTFTSLAEVFASMTTETPHPLDFNDVMKVLKKAILERKKGIDAVIRPLATDLDITHIHWLLVIIMHLLCLLCRLQAQMGSKEEHHFKQTVHDFLRLNPRGNKDFTPLHMACSKETTNLDGNPVCNFPSSDVVQLLVEVGADVNAVDIDGNTPLHTAASNVETTPSNRPCRVEIVRTLLKSGAHLDACNDKRKTPMQLIKGMKFDDIISPLSFISLQCLAARIIMKHNLDYKNTVPKKLESFIAMH